VSALLERAIAAHGGRERWERLRAIDIAADVGGPAFALKGRGLRRRRLRARVRAHEPHVTFSDFGAPGRTGTFDRGAVAIGDRRRGADEARASARGRPWDDLDELYFDGYALWQYATAPFAFAGAGFEVRDGPGAGTLRVRFPADVPSHSREQVFHFDRDGVLRRLDYTAEVMGPWAHAAHLCAAHRTFAGVVVPTRRRVHPLLPGGLVVRPVTLVAIDVVDVRAVEDPPRC
jgi:hypothetical protein